KYSGCWGWYQANKNREYAIAGSSKGTFFVDVTNPYLPVVCDFEAGAQTDHVWREIKTYQNYCYVVSDDSGPNSFQIFDMQYLPDSVHKVYDSQALFRRGHATWIDQNKLYVSGVTYSTGATDIMNVYSLATPTAPTLIRRLKQDANFINGVHDSFIINDTVFVSAGYQGLYVFLLTSPSNTFQQLGSLTTYPSSGYNHSSAITPNRKTLVFMDEVPASLPIKIADVQNFSNIQVLATINQHSLTTPHNPFMANDSLCFVSAYSDGIQLFNIKNPSAPFLAGYFDTYPQGGANTGTYTGNYNGQWGAYPWFPSKNIFALDQNNGIFMLKTHMWKNPPVPSSEGGIGTSGGSGVSTHTGNVSTVGIKENSHDNFIHFFPNPANNKIRMNVPVEFLNQSLTIKLLDLTGKVLLTENHNNEKDLVAGYFKEIDLSNINSGVYFAKVYHNKTLIKKTKFVVNK
ncbi:MAG: choice-of-anchor B family protein, partial [Bacteroidia bacterium]|nr:choice-of-anchor B family protein [Bacteroidia bacterium]